MVDRPTPSDGEFNLTVPSGPIHLNVNETGFGSASLFLNVTGVAVHLGTLRLDPMPRVTGRIAFGPWSEPTGTFGMVPNDAAIEVCSASRLSCGPARLPSANGSFDVPAPAGTQDEILVMPALTTLTNFSFGP